MQSAITDAQNAQAAALGQATFALAQSQADTNLAHVTAVADADSTVATAQAGALDTQVRGDAQAESDDAMAVASATLAQAQAAADAAEAADEQSISAGEQWTDSSAAAVTSFWTAEAAEQLSVASDMASDAAGTPDAAWAQFFAAQSEAMYTTTLATSQAYVAQATTVAGADAAAAQQFAQADDTAAMASAQADYQASQAIAQAACQYQESTADASAAYVTSVAPAAASYETAVAQAGHDEAIAAAQAAKEYGPVNASGQPPTDPTDYYAALAQATDEQNSAVSSATDAYDQAEFAAHDMQGRAVADALAQMQNSAVGAVAQQSASEATATTNDALAAADAQQQAALAAALADFNFTNVRAESIADAFAASAANDPSTWAAAQAATYEAQSASDEAGAATQLTADTQTANSDHDQAVADAEAQAQLSQATASAGDAADYAAIQSQHNSALATLAADAVALDAGTYSPALPNVSAAAAVTPSNLQLPGFALPTAPASDPNGNFAGVTGEAYAAATPLQTPSHDPIGELVPGLTEQDQLNSRSFLDTVVSEAITAGKAFVNGVASAGYSVVTLGLGHLTNMPYAVTQEDIANGYNTMESAVQFTTTIAIYAGSGGVAALLEEGGALASAASGGLELFMTATNVSFAGQGVYSIATNGLTWQNALQVGLSGFALSSELSEAFSGLNAAGNVAGDLELAAANDVETMSGTFSDPASVNDFNLSQRLDLQFKHQSLINLLRQGDVELQSGNGWAQLMGELTVATGQEVGLITIGAQRLLRLGLEDSIYLGDAERIIAHTHPSGILTFSNFGGVEGDIPAFQELLPLQRSSILVAPDGTWVRLAIPRVGE